MPPRGSTKVVRAAKKRKNVDRSDDESDSDFDYTHHSKQRNTSKQKPRQGRQEHSSKVQVVRSSRKQKQHAVPSLSASDSPSPPADGWRAELSEMKRAKRFTEDDRGFVFTRKKKIAVEAVPEVSKSVRSRYVVDDSLAHSTPLRPPTPERTPSKDKPRRGALASSNRQVPSMDLSTPRNVRRLTFQTPDNFVETDVAIPMRETPTINKNKDLRSANRRSSLTMRGKRASSIGNGFTALPHPSVDPKTFFRHISADDPAPIRMKQLMAWCARISIDKQRSKSQTALRIAKGVEEEVLAMLISGQFSVSWYSRPLDKDPIRTAPKKPHQQNTENMRKLRECEAQIAKLRKEDEDWTKVISSFNTFHAALLDSGAKLPPGNEPVFLPESFVEEIDLNLLTADERSLWEKHCKPKERTSTPSKSLKAGAQADGAGLSRRDSNKWMTEMMSTLETEVDSLRDTLYSASRFDKMAKQYTDQVLEQIALALDERQHPRTTESSIPLLAGIQTSSSSTSSFLSAAGAKDSSIPTTKSALSSSRAGGIGSSSGGDGFGPDSVDDPRQILRALSRLSL
ncbi:hypothetical protein EC957_002060 [Mortierella hygrophila]|uniref:Kinetochore protein mis13 n=1 Tax=Mortierella hygrophila TaxID=979708 RepID=A0A9P6FG30_9FUNG|nr:hypothetical protein EC957_002060 [Mortierella hygrophila]